MRDKTKREEKKGEVPSNLSFKENAEEVKGNMSIRRVFERQASAPGLPQVTNYSMGKGRTLT
jgi:hypothetical protein